MKPPPRILRRAGLAVALVLGAIQFVPVNRSNPRVQTDVAAPDSVASILRRACYDCHSNETKWPWYSRIAPASWFVTNHVKRGRGDLNFSEWPAFDFELQEGAFRDIDEQIAKGRMPLRSYTLIHPGARLSEDDRKMLRRWSGSLGAGY